MAWDSTNQRLFVIDGSGRELWRINTANPLDETGDFGLVGILFATNNTLRGMAWDDANQRLFVVDQFRLYIVNPDDPDDESGDFGLVQQIAVSGSLIAVTFDGSLLYFLEGNEEVHSADPSDIDGTFTSLGRFPFATASSGLTFVPAQDPNTDNADKFVQTDSTGAYYELVDAPSGGGATRTVIYDNRINLTDTPAVLRVGTDDLLAPATGDLQVFVYAKEGDRTDHTGGLTIPIANLDDTLTDGAMLIPIGANRWIEIEIENGREIAMGTQNASGSGIHEV